MRTFFAGLGLAVAFSRAVAAEPGVVQVDADRATDFDDPIPLSGGQLVESEISATDYSFYPGMASEHFRFSGRAGETITFEARSDAALEVLVKEKGRNGNVLVRGSANGNASSVMLPADAEYQLIVGSAEKQAFGRYTLAFGRALPGQVATAAPVAPIAAPAFAPATIASDAGASAEWKKRWGPYAQMVGRTWFVGSYEVSGGSAVDPAEPPEFVMDVSWGVPGEQMISTGRKPTGEVVSNSITTWDPASGVLLTALPGADAPGRAEVQADGSVVQLTETPEVSVRSTLRLLSDGSIETLAESNHLGIWVFESRLVMYEYTPEAIALARATAPTWKERAEADRRHALAEKTRMDDIHAAATEAAWAAGEREAEARRAASTVVPGTGGVLLMDPDGEYDAADGEWDDEEQLALFELENGGSAAPAASSYLPTKGLYDALVQANAEADAHLAQTQASYDATMAQAREQAAAERAQAAAADTADAAERQRQLANAQEATRRQYEIARQYEARRQAAEAQRQADEAARRQQAAATTTVPSTSSTAATTTSAPGEAVMGFRAPTCAAGRAAAQGWVGSGGTFQIKSEEVQASGGCVVQIHHWQSGSGTASRQ